MDEEGVRAKKAVYLLLFAFLGYLLQLAAHALIETGYISLLLSNYDVFGFGLPWNSWFTIHTMFTWIFGVGGVAGGFWQGMYWWPKLYDAQGKVRNNLPWRKLQK